MRNRVDRGHITRRCRELYGVATLRGRLRGDVPQQRRREGSVSPCPEARPRTLPYATDQETISESVHLRKKTAIAVISFHPTQT